MQQDPRQTPEFIIVFSAGEPEALRAESFDHAIKLIEEWVGDNDAELAYVLEVETITDGVRRGHDRTEQFLDRLSDREAETLTDRFHDGGHNFASLEGFLEVQEWRFPPEWIRKAQDGHARAMKRCLERVVPVEGGGAVVIPAAAE